MIDYRLGLSKLTERFHTLWKSSRSEWEEVYIEVLGFQAEVEAILSNCEKYGGNPTDNARFNQVIVSLNKTALSEFEISFNKLCHEDSTNPQQGSNSGHPSNSIKRIRSLLGREPTHGCWNDFFAAFQAISTELMTLAGIGGMGSSHAFPPPEAVREVSTTLDNLNDFFETLEDWINRFSLKDHSFHAIPCQRVLQAKSWLLKNEDLATLGVLAEWLYLQRDSGNGFSGEIYKYRKDQLDIAEKVRRLSRNLRDLAEHYQNNI